jgi:hypothetical protein
VEGVDPRGNRYVLLPDRVRVETVAGRTRDVPLGDVSRPGFLALPRIDLDDGRSLRRAAFETWAWHVREVVADDAVFETPLRHPDPANAVLAIGGGVLVAAVGVLILFGMLAAEDTNRVVEPSLVEVLLRGAVVVALGWIVFKSATAARRAWLCRGGSFVHVDRRGIRTRKGQRIRPFDVVTAVRYDRMLRCTRLEFLTDEPPLWVPASSGPLSRLDLFLAALHPPLADGIPDLR